MSVSDPTAAFDDALREHRRQLDTIDAELVSLLAKRFSITRRIGELKADHQAPAADPERERAQLERLSAEAERQGLAPDVVRGVFDALFVLVRSNHTAIAARANSVEG